MTWMHQSSLSILLVVACCCSSARFNADETGQPSLVFPTRFAEGDAGAPVEGSTGDAVPQAAAATPVSAAPEGPSPPVAAMLPDPEPLALSSQWEYVLRYRRGKVTVESTRLLSFKQPVVTAREMGRFALELWIGQELIERVRFDFPLLAAEPAPASRQPLLEPPTFAPGADVVRKLLVPASPRATRAVLVDRATREETELAWPPPVKTAAKAR